MGASQSSPFTLAHDDHISLPDHICFYILSYVSLNSVLACSLVNQQVHAITRGVPVLHIHWNQLDAARAVHLSNQFSRVKYLTIFGCHVATKDGVSAILQANPQLVSFAMAHSRIRGIHIKAITRESANLETLRLSGSSFLDHDLIEQMLLQHCNLSTLDISGSRELKDETVDAILRHLPLLTNLNLDGCTALQAPSFSSQVLERLSLSECARLAAVTFVDCPRLQTLNLSNCRVLSDDALVNLVGQCSSLRDLRLDGCHSLRHVHLENHTLERLDMALCTQLKTVRIESDSIVHLDVGMCIEMVELSVQLARIEHLDLSMLSVQSLSLACPKLSELNLCGSRSISALTEDCPRLRVVHLSGSNVSPDKFDLDRVAVSDNHMPERLP